VVNHEELADLAEYWGPADDHLLREYQIAQRLTAPANFIVHALTDVNQQLTRGRPFFVDIVRDGIVLYEAPGGPLEATLQSLAKSQFDMPLLGLGWGDELADPLARRQPGGSLRAPVALV